MSGPEFSNYVEAMSTYVEEKVSIDFSRAVAKVFWDVEDFPLPKGRDLLWFHETVKGALVEAGYSGAATVNVYGMKKPRKELFNNAEFTFEPIANKFFRVNQMLLDMCSWTHKHPDWYADPIVLMVISKGHESTEFASYLEELRGSNFTVLLVLPVAMQPQVMIQVSGAWFWDHLLQGGKHFVRAPLQPPFPYPERPPTKRDVLTMRPPVLTKKDR